MTAAPVDAVAATLRDFVARAGALRAVALLDRGRDAAPLVVDCGADGAAEVDDAGEVRRLPPAADAAPLAAPHVRPLPPMEVDPGELAAALGGRSVATVQFATTDPDTPLAVSARAGEAPVVALGDRTFTLPD